MEEAPLRIVWLCHLAFPESNGLVGAPPQGGPTPLQLRAPELNDVPGEAGHSLSERLLRTLFY